jgi:hypothetical protein
MLSELQIEEPEEGNRKVPDHESDRLCLLCGCRVLRLFII